MDQSAIGDQLRLWQTETYPRAAAKIGRPDDPPPQIRTPVDVEDLDFLRDVGLPGHFPFTSWLYPTRTPLEEGEGGLQRAGRYSGYGSSEDCRDYYADMRARGLRLGGPNIASDLPSQLGWDSDSPEAAGEVGRVGVAIDSLRDFEVIYEPFAGESDISRIASNWTINAPALVYVAFYAALARKRGLPTASLRCTPQNDILKEYTARGLYIFPIEPSLRLVGDVIEFVSRSMPRSNSISICAEHLRYAGASTPESLAFAIANAEEYVRIGKERGLDVDDFVQRFTFRGFGDSSLNFFRGIAAPRASRRVWARLMREKYGAKEDRTCILRGGEHAWGNAYLRMTVQRPVNNIARETIEALIQAAASGQVAGSFPFDEPLGLGHSLEAQQIRRDLERIIEYEAGFGEHLDPFAGSYLIESLTDEIEAAVLEELELVREQGGSRACVENGYFRERIAASAWRSQRDLESGKDRWVGVNAFTGPDEIDVQISRTSEYDKARIESAEERQIAALQQLRRERSERDVNRALHDLEAACGTNKNLVEPVIECALSYATLGEICGVFRSAFGEAVYL